MLPGNDIIRLPVHGVASDGWVNVTLRATN